MIIIIIYLTSEILIREFFKLLVLVMVDLLKGLLTYQGLHMKETAGLSIKGTVNVAWSIY